MSTRTKKILRNFLFLLSVPLIVGAFVFARTKSTNELCKGVSVIIQNPEITFVTEDEILNTLKATGFEPNKTIIKDINIQKLESILRANKWVQAADIFIAASDRLTVKLIQREPVVRIQDKDSTDYAYYLDAYANPIELNANYIPELPVVTVSDLGYTKHDLNYKSSLVQLAKHIQADTFWSVAITQIDADAKGNIELIPAVGNQVIKFGRIVDIDDKLNRLLAFYKQHATSLSWDKYDEIDLRYKKQIICRSNKGIVLSEDPYDTKSKELFRKETSTQNRLSNTKKITKTAISGNPVHKQNSKSKTN